MYLQVRGESQGKMQGPSYIIRVDASEVDSPLLNMSQAAVVNIPESFASPGLGLC